MVFSEKKKIPGKTNCYVPSDKHKLIQNFIHSQLTNKSHKHRLIALRDLYDCHLLLKKVKIDDVLNEIKEKEKAEIYFDFHESLFKRDFNLSEFDAKSKRFIAQHHWFMNHPRMHYYCTKLLKSKELITNRFLKPLLVKQYLKTWL